MKSYTFFTDAGHGWLEVPRADLVELGVADKISKYSYQKGDNVYLEEDCDATVFVEAFKDKYGASPFFVDVYHDKSPVRNYQRFVFEL